MTYTKVSKPSIASYTRVNPAGKEEYDQVSVSYDDSNIYYDGVNQGQYTKVAKPTTSSWVTVAKPT